MVQVYAVLRGDLELFVYRRSFVHVANEPYREDFDPEDGYRTEVSA